MPELTAEDQAKVDEVMAYLRRPCERCGREQPTGSVKDWHHGVELLCPDCAPPKRPPSPRVKELQAQIRQLRADRRESDDPTERENLAIEIEDLEAEIEQAEADDA